MYRDQQPMTDAQLQVAAPSVFAGQAYDEMSGKYAFVSTSEIVNGMRDAGFMPMSAQQSNTRIIGKRNFTKHMIRFRSNTPLVNVSDMALETVVINSHDGSSAYTGHCGLIRFACMNGLIVSDAMVNSFKVRHVGHIVESILAANAEMLESAPRAIEVVQTWKQLILTRDAQIVFAEFAHMLRFEEGSTLAQTFSPESLLTPRRYSDNGDDLWSVFNRVQENVVRGGKVRTGGFRTRKIRGVNGIDESTKLNKALWSLAEKMASLVKNSN
jgi:hypothetical protein